MQTGREDWYFQRMRPFDNLFGAMHYLQTTFRNNEKTVLVERNYIINGRRKEEVIKMSVLLASAAQYFENGWVANGC